MAAGAVLYVVTIRLSSYDDYQVGEIAAYIVALVGLSLLTGVNGQISLGHGGFMAVGAYTMALLMNHTQSNFILELAAANGVAAAVGLVIGLPATRIKGPYLAGMTLLFALAVPSIADKWPATFGGDQGLTTTVPTAPGSLGAEEWLAWIQIIGALVVMVLVANLLWSRYGRAFRAVRDDEIAASLAGIHVARTKVTTFAISAGCAGLGGALLGLSTGVVNTGEFPLTLSIQLLAAMVLGGTGTLIGNGLGRHPPGVPAAVVDLAVFGLQPGQWGECLSGHDHLRRRVDRSDDRGADRHPGWAAMGVGASAASGSARAPRGDPRAGLDGRLSSARPSKPKKGESDATEGQEQTDRIGSRRSGDCRRVPGDHAGGDDPAAAAEAQSTPGVTSTSITIGATVLLTGPAAPGYDEIAPAMNAVFSYVDAHGGVNGRKINYTYLDDGYNPANTATLTW